MIVHINGAMVAVEHAPVHDMVFNVAKMRTVSVIE
jgi:hypothetical protein